MKNIALILIILIIPSLNFSIFGNEKPCTGKNLEKFRRELLKVLAKGQVEFEKMHEEELRKLNLSNEMIKKITPKTERK